MSDNSGNNGGNFSGPPTMHTLVLDAPGALRLADMPLPPSPGPGESLVRVRRIGVCGTDLHAFHGRQPFFTYPRILGHELGVEVEEVGPGETALRPGDRCSVEPYLNCGKCIACRRGKPNCCVQLQVLGVHIDGGMRERIVVPSRKLHSSASLDFDHLALVETLGIGCHAVERAALRPGEWAVVVGAGPIGLSVMQFAREAGVQVIAMDINAARLEFCRAAMGVLHTIDARSGDPLGALRELTGGDLATAVFEATGNPKSMEGSFEFAAAGGRLVFVGLCQGGIAFNDPQFHRRELALFATRNALPGDFERIIGLMESGRIDIAPWITHRAAFTASAGLFDSWSRPETGVIKAMISVE